MFHLRRRWGTLVASASRLLPQAEVCASLATGPRQYDGTFYEFRTYIIQPGKMNEFLENTHKHIHLRTAHSELVGFWKQEFGGVMNKVFHIWKYDNFVHRAKVREAVAEDKEWQEKYISPNLPFVVQQRNEIAYLVPWCKLGKPPKEGESFSVTRSLPEVESLIRFLSQQDFSKSVMFKTLSSYVTSIGTGDDY